MINKMPPKQERIALAKAKMTRVLDDVLYLLELHANNAIVVHSPALSSQIPRSYAANAFVVFQRSMYQIEVVRLCALWDAADIAKENVPTVIELIDDDEIIEQLGDENLQHWSGSNTPIANLSSEPDLAALEREATAESERQFGREQAAKGKQELRQAIADSRAIIASQRLASVMNLRDKYLAHSLERTRREKHGPIQPMKYGDETTILDATTPIVERLYSWVAGKSFSIVQAQEIDRANAEALWKGCKFTVLC
jgi:HEPN superfamily AbiU2-like protein